MPRKPRGLIGRLASAAAKPFRRRKPPPPPPPERPPPPPPQPRPVPPPVPRIDAAARHELRMQQIYVDITAPHEPPGNGLTGYLDWREIYDPLSIIFDTPQQVERYWDRFMRAYYLTTHDAGFERRETFHNDTGIPYGEMDWDLWRMMRRGTP